jgi:hypothetical protein
MTPKSKSAYLSARVTDKTRAKFHAKASRFSTPSDVLRELIDAFVEDRITIQPPVIRNSLEKIYVNRSQN